MLDIQDLIANPEHLNEETLPKLKELTEKYPFFQAARILYVRNLYLQHSPNFSSELKKASVFVPDRTTLFSFSEGQNYILESEGTRSTKIEVENNDGNRTISLIEDFLNQAKSDSSRPSIADLTTDYASFLIKSEAKDEDVEEKENDAPQLRGAHLINSFIEENKGKQRVEIQELPEETEFCSPDISDEEEEIYTENMVNIYIKQGRYMQALEILRKICLNNPEKNINFAAQINLLEVITSGKQN